MRLNIPRVVFRNIVLNWATDISQSLDFLLLFHITYTQLFVQVNIKCMAENLLSRSKHFFKIKVYSYIANAPSNFKEDP